MDTIKDMGDAHLAASARSDDALHRLAAIVDSCEDAIISKDLDGIVETWNNGACQVYGYTAAEAIGRSITFLLPPDRADEETRILERIRRGERVEHIETERVRKDGRQIVVSVTISPIRNRAGQIIGASHIARDVTERRQFDEQLRQTQKLESLGLLAGGVAHDFNNLLTGIMGNASLALETLSTNNPARRMLRDVIEASDRAAHLTRQLLAYAGKGRFVIEALDLSDLIREISALIQTSIPKHVQLRLDLQDRLACVHGDASQIQQLIMNLVINGAEAIPEGTNGTVLVTTGEQEVDEAYVLTTFGPDELTTGKYVTLEVHDTGCGMDEATISQIFDPFFTTKFTGRGLGLAAALGIVRGHKGAMKVYSTPGKGSTFKVLLPATEDEPARPRRLEQPVVAAGTATVLVVDDEQVVRRTAKSMLERFGYTVILAENGREGVDLFRVLADKISVVLLDMTMPVMGGEEALRNLQMIRRDVKVILSSGYNEVEAIRRFTGKGLAGFIQKPYSATALAEKIRSVLDSDMSAI